MSPLETAFAYLWFAIPPARGVDHRVAAFPGSVRGDKTLTPRPPGVYGSPTYLSSFFFLLITSSLAFFLPPGQLASTFYDFLYLCGAPKKLGLAENNHMTLVPESP